MRKSPIQKILDIKPLQVQGVFWWYWNDKRIKLEFINEAAESGELYNVYEQLYAEFMGWV